MIGLIHIVIGSFHVCHVYRGALRRLMHTEVCIGLDIAHFPSLMYGFIMQQIYIIYIYTYIYRQKQSHGRFSARILMFGIIRKTEGSPNINVCKLRVTVCL